MRLLSWLFGIGDAGSIAEVLEWRLSPVTALPMAWVVLLALAGLVVAGLSFDPRLRIPRRTRVALCLLRLLGVVVILGMLLRLEVPMEVNRVLPPRVGVLTDTSGSMGLTDGEGRTRLERAERIRTALDASLAGRCALAHYSFSGTLGVSGEQADAKGPTRLGRAILALLEREPEVDALVVLSDGHDPNETELNAAAAAMQRRNVRAYPVVVGSTVAPPRAEVRAVVGAPYLRLGDRYRVSARLKAEGREEQTVRVSLYQDGKDRPVAVRENVHLTADPVTVSFVVQPERAGWTQYRFEAEGAHREAGRRLPAATYALQVLDTKIRVLYLDVPRDERKLLGVWLPRDPVVELATLTSLPAGGWYSQGAVHHKAGPDGWPVTEGDLFRYDVIILGDLPRKAFRHGGGMNEARLQWIADFVNRRGGGLITLGGRNAYGAGGYADSPLAGILPFRIEAAKESQIPGKYALVPTDLGLDHPILQLAGGREGNRDAWAALPLLDGSTRLGALRPGAALLATRMVKTDDQEVASAPLMAFQNVGKGKVLALAADTTWRWQMLGPERRQEHYRQFWGNALRYLAPDPRLQPDRAQAMPAESDAQVGMTVPLTTRLVDKRFRPIRDADLTIAAIRPSGRTTVFYPADSIQEPGVYQIDLRLDEPGAWLVRSAFNNETSEQRLLVEDGPDELADPRAQPERMAAFAAGTGGRAFSAAEAPTLPSALALTPRHRRETLSVALWNCPLAMLLLLGVIGVDCLVRKRRGLA